MRYTRFEFKRRDKMDMKGYIMRFLILIPVIAILLGLFISKLIIIPLVFKMENKKEAQMPQNENKITSQPVISQPVKPRKYYIIQAGIFSSKENADKFLGRLHSSGIPAIAREEEQYFRVFIGAGVTKEYLESRTAACKQKGYECIIKEISISSPDSTGNGKSTGNLQLNSLVNNLGNAIDGYMNLTEELDQNKLEYGKFIESMSDTCSSLSKDIEDAKASGQDKTVSSAGTIEKANNIVNILSGCLKLEKNASTNMVLQEKGIEVVLLYRDLIGYLNKEVSNMDSGGTHFFIGLYLNGNVWMLSSLCMK